MNRLVTVLSLFFIAGCTSPSVAKAGCNPFVPDFRECLEERSQEQARVAAQNLANLQAHKAMQIVAKTLAQTTFDLEPRVVAQGNAQIQEALTKLVRLNAEIVTGLDLMGFPEDVTDGPLTGMLELLNNPEDLRSFRIQNNANMNALPICFLSKATATSATEVMSQQTTILSAPSNYSPENVVVVIRAAMSEQAKILQALQVYNAQLQQFVQERDMAFNAHARIDQFVVIVNAWKMYNQRVRALNASPDVVCTTKASVATQLLGMTERTAKLLGFFVP